MDGIVFNIQRFSTHDGPGIRTTVFLKGCTNHCAWCHNPESIQRAPEVQIFPDRCIMCSRCLEICEVHAHELVDGEKVYHRELCVRCGECIEECFAGSITMAGKSMTDDEVMEEILKDEPYYRNSQGGVTFSGGEPVMQKEFLLALLQRCKAHDIHTLIETAGNYSWDYLEDLLPYIDLIMYDLKIFDPELHRRYIGNRGERVRDNLQKLAETRRPIIVRTPVIGGVNDTEEEISNIARFIKDIEALEYYALLPYHSLGNAKRPSLGLKEEDGFTAPSKERMQELANIAREYVADVKP